MLAEIITERPELEVLLGLLVHVCTAAPKAKEGRGSWVGFSWNYFREFTPIITLRHSRSRQRRRDGQNTNAGSNADSDAMSHVLVMCAMEEQARYLRDRMDDCSEVPLTGAMRRTRGTIGGVTVDLVISGIGGVYATMATTAAILDQKPTAVFSCGCSGAHVRDLRMGDVVIASEVKPLDAIVLERSGKVRLVRARVSHLSLRAP